MGSAVGVAEGVTDGVSLGELDGENEGECVGTNVGESVGTGVGSGPSRSPLRLSPTSPARLHPLLGPLLPGVLEFRGPFDFPDEDIPPFDFLHPLLLLTGPLLPGTLELLGPFELDDLELLEDGAFVDEESEFIPKCRFLCFPNFSLRNEKRMELPGMKRAHMSKISKLRACLVAVILITSLGGLCLEYLADLEIVRVWME